MKEILHGCKNRQVTLEADIFWQSLGNTRVNESSSSLPSLCARGRVIWSIDRDLGSRHSNHVESIGETGSLEIVLSFGRFYAGESFKGEEKEKKSDATDGYPVVVRMNR